MNHEKKIEIKRILLTSQRLERTVLNIECNHRAGIGIVFETGLKGFLLLKKKIQVYQPSFEKHD